MKLKYTLLALVGIGSLSANAQTAQSMASEAPAHRVALTNLPLALWRGGGYVPRGEQ